MATTSSSAASRCVHRHSPRSAVWNVFACACASYSAEPRAWLPLSWSLDKVSQCLYPSAGRVASAAGPLGTLCSNQMLCPYITRSSTLCFLCNTQLGARLQRLGPEDAQFIYDSAAENCLDVATHRHGCCVLQRCLDFANATQRARLVDCICQHVLLLAQVHEAPNALHRLCFSCKAAGTPESCTAPVVWALLAVQIPVGLSWPLCNRLSANTCMSSGVSSHACANTLSLPTAQDPFGNYVVQYVLELGDVEASAKVWAQHSRQTRFLPLALAICQAKLALLDIIKSGGGTMTAVYHCAGVLLSYMGNPCSSSSQLPLPPRAGHAGAGGPLPGAGAAEVLLQCCGEVH